MKPISPDALATVLEQVTDPWWLVDPETSRCLLASQAERGMRFIAAAVESSRANAAWTAIEP